MDGGVSIKRRERPENSPYPSADDPDIIHPILDELGAEDELRSLAIKIASTVESTMWVVGKRRSTVAATAIYVAGILESTGEPIYKQKEVAEASSTSIGSIINQHQELQTVYESLISP